MKERIERAAGGLVVRGTPGQREVLLIDDAYGHVTFPKGHLERGETWEVAAVREILEETGIETRIVAPLGRVEYPITRDGQPVRKQVRFFLLEAIDEAVAPVHQAEEVSAAYFLPFDEAARKHDASGYANWAFVFRKADALLQWLDGGYEHKWRQLSADESSDKIDSVFEDVKPGIASLLAACQEELSITISDIKLPEVDLFVPSTAPSADDVRKAVEHTLLKPEASLVDVENLCDEAQAHQFPLVCINPQFVEYATDVLQGTQTNVCTVIGFPFGTETPETLATTVPGLAAKGAVEIDMVVPVGSMAEDDVWTVYNHVRSVVDAAAQTKQKPKIKVILETSALTADQVVKAGMVSIAAGADFIKTSTGFHKGGARLADVQMMASVTGESGQVKASGGIKTPAAARQMLRYGANRLGTSSGVQLIRQ